MKTREEGSGDPATDIEMLLNLPPISASINRDAKCQPRWIMAKGEADEQLNGDIKARGLSCPSSRIEYLLYHID